MLYRAILYKCFLTLILECFVVVYFIIQLFLTPDIMLAYVCWGVSILAIHSYFPCEETFDPYKNEIVNLLFA